MAEENANDKIHKEKKNGEKKETPAQQPDEKEKYLRLLAEFDNAKKRMQVDLANAKTMGRAETIKNLLPLVDEFELMIVAAKKSDDEPMAKGIEMLYSKLLDFLKANGVKEIPATGRADPMKHDIMLTREDGKHPQGTIIEVVRKGYQIGEIQLRPATVIVAKEPEKKDDANKK